MNLKKYLVILGAALLCLCLPMRVSAATEGDVYAALRSIGVPESYISQAAGMLARGTSDGAGVYRSDGTYYSYSSMVSYIYANRETILLYCGIDPDTGGAVTTTASGASGGTTAASGSSGGNAGSTDSTEAVTSDTTTTTTVTTTTTTLTTTSTTRLTSSRTRISTSAVSDPAESSGKGGITAAAVCMILAAGAGIGGMAVILRRNGGE